MACLRPVFTFGVSFAVRSEEVLAANRRGVLKYQSLYGMGFITTGGSEANVQLLTELGLKPGRPEPHCYASPSMHVPNPPPPGCSTSWAQIFFPLCLGFYTLLLQPTVIVRASRPRAVCALRFPWGVNAGRTLPLVGTV